jgi:uncharacterized protein YceK
MKAYFVLYAYKIPIIFSILVLSGCATIPDETQATHPPFGLIEICQRSAAQYADDHPNAIHNDPMCLEAMQRWTDWTE